MCLMSAWAVLRAHMQGRLGERGVAATVASGARRAVPLMLLITFLLLLPTASRICQTFLCDTYEFDDLAGSQRRYLQRDPSLDCDSSEYAYVRKWALAYFSVWPVGVPVLYLYLLYLCRAGLHARRPTKLAAATRFLWADYCPRYFWWEPIETGSECERISV